MLNREKLEELLKNRSMTQEDLGGAIGKSQQTISHYLGGKRGKRIPYETICDIAEFFNIPPDELIVRHRPPPPTASDEPAAVGDFLAA